MRKKPSNRPRAFSDIQTVQELISYLDNPYFGNKVTSLYHYTKLSTVVKIIKSGYWHLTTAEQKNDVLEYENGDKEAWKSLFFTCFMSEDVESIAMWSMYAQPWDDGVKIRIGLKEVRKWIQTVKNVAIIDEKTCQATGDLIPVSSENLKLSGVAYINTENENQQVLKFGNQENNKIQYMPKSATLTGYVKDSAWSYEKELRLKVRVHNENNRIKRIGLPIDSLINDMEISAGPMFKGSLEKRLFDEIHRQVKLNQSYFTGKLNIKNPCDECEAKKEAQAEYLQFPIQ